MFCICRGMGEVVDAHIVHGCDTVAIKLYQRQWQNWWTRMNKYINIQQGINEWLTEQNRYVEQRLVVVNEILTNPLESNLNEDVTNFTHEK